MHVDSMAMRAAALTLQLRPCSNADRGTELVRADGIDDEVRVEAADDERQQPRYHLHAETAGCRCCRVKGL